MANSRSGEGHVNSIYQRHTKVRPEGLSQTQEATTGQKQYSLSFNDDDNCKGLKPTR